MDNERCYHRFSVPGARLKGATFDAPVVNLSKNGLAIKTAHALEPGDSYGAWLETASNRSWVEGRVVWCEPKTSRKGEEAAAFEVGLSVWSIDTEDPEQPAPDSAAPEPPASRPRGVRSSPRVDVSGMFLRTEDLDAEVVNFGSRGLAIRADRPLEAGETHDARLETQDGTVFLRAVVVWCQKREASEEGGAASYVAGMSLSDVDQRLHPLAEDFVPKSEEVELLGSDASSVGEDGTGLDDLAPWLAEVPATATPDEMERPSRWPGRRVGAALATVSALGMFFALWLFFPRSSEKTAAPDPAAGSARSPGPALGDTGLGGSNTAVSEAASAALLASEPRLDDDGVDSQVDPQGETGEAMPALGPAALGTILPRADVNVRSGPGLGFPIIRRTGENERLPFVTKEGEWFRLQGEEESWMHEVTVLVVQELAQEPPETDSTLAESQVPVG